MNIKKKEINFQFLQSYFIYLIGKNPSGILSLLERLLIVPILVLLNNNNGDTKIIIIMIIITIITWKANLFHLQRY